MDKAGINMDDRPVRTLRSLPKSSIKSDIAFIRRIISKISQFLHLKKRNSSSEEPITSTEKIKLSIKSENKLKNFSENELKHEWKNLIKKFRKAAAQCIQCRSSNSFTLVSNKKKKTKWIKQVKKLVNEIDKPSIIDNDIKNHTGDAENLADTDLIDRRERLRTQKEDERTEGDIEDEITIE
jgi:hypothetical protein